MAAIRYLLTIAAAAGPALAAEADDDCRVTFRGMGAKAPQRRALCQCILSELHSAGTVVSERAAALESA
jgi:hypothetical protein